MKSTRIRNRGSSLILSGTSLLVPLFISLVGSDVRATTDARSAWTSTRASSGSGKAKPKCNKKFKKALVLSGGGITPGIALGIIAGARAAGQKPDVIITSCGSSISGAISNSYPNPKDAKAFVTSRAFHQFLLEITHVGKTDTAHIGLKLAKASAQFLNDKIPDIFDHNIMEIPSSPPRILPRQTFTSTPGETRLITLAAKALYKPSEVGNDRGERALYKQTYFTDADTARSLRKLPASMKSNFPNSWMQTGTEVRTDVSTIQAARASISDPYLVDPAKIKDDYYFGGAMDLFPMETAHSIACETLGTWPGSGYTDIEDMAVKRGFGFSQAERAYQLYKYKGVRWVHMDGADDMAMDPDVSGLSLVNKIPTKYSEFRALIEKQYDFGYRRALESYGLKDEASEPAAAPGDRNGSVTQ